MPGSRPLFHLSHESTLLIALLRKMNVGDVLSYEEINEAIGGDVQRAQRFALSTARKRLMLEDQIHFGTIIGVGIKRLDDHGAVESLDIDVSRVRSGARRVHRKTRLIDMVNLAAAERAKVAMVQTLSAVIERSTSNKSQDRLLQAGENVSLKKAFAALSGEKD